MPGSTLEAARKVSTIHSVVSKASILKRKGNGAKVVHTEPHTQRI